MLVKEGDIVQNFIFNKDLYYSTYQNKTKELIQQYHDECHNPNSLFNTTKECYSTKLNQYLLQVLYRKFTNIDELTPKKCDEILKHLHLTPGIFKKESEINSFKVSLKHFSKYLRFINH